MIPTFEVDGNLPRGRWVTDPQEVEADLVHAPLFSSSTTRTKVWDDFIIMVNLVAKRVPVPAAFLGGSFVTSKPDPGDIDVALIIDVSRANPVTLGVVQSLVRDPRSRGLQLDVFLIQWYPTGTQLGGDPGYAAQRGSWDDFWQRSVPAAERLPVVRSHAMPTRGYLEVVINGYS